MDSEPTSCEMVRRAILQATGADIPHCYPQDFYPVFGSTPRDTISYYKRLLKRWGTAGAPALSASPPKLQKRQTPPDPLKPVANASIIIHLQRLQ